MSYQKRNKETENFIIESQKEQSLWNVCSPIYKDRNMCHESVKRLMAKFTATSK